MSKTRTLNVIPNGKRMKNKKTTVYETLKKRIIEGSLSPGLAINEDEFAKDLNVSKTPLREALRQLERQGLVENVPGRGSIVTHISFHDIREIFELREIIECGAVKRAAMICDVDAVKAKKKELEEFYRQSNKPKSKVWGSNEDVHQFIINCLNNRKLNETYSDLQNQIIRIRNHFGSRYTSKRRLERFKEHSEIYDALIEGNAERAEKAIQDHLRSFAAQLLGLF
jgi:DNA-binding GntR family transcriptional regulator